MSADLRGALAPKGTRNYPAITDPAKVGVLFRAMQDHEGMPSTSAALTLSPYVFVRPGELRAAERPEFDLEGALWRFRLNE